MIEKDAFSFSYCNAGAIPDILNTSLRCTKFISKDKARIKHLPSHRTPLYFPCGRILPYMDILKLLCSKRLNVRVNCMCHIKNTWLWEKVKANDWGYTRRLATFKYSRLPPAKTSTTTTTIYANPTPPPTTHKYESQPVFCYHVYNLYLKLIKLSKPYVVTLYPKTPMEREKKKTPNETRENPF